MEAKDLLPKMEKSLKTIFGYMDTAIHYTNKAQADAYIWRSIDDKEIAVIASHIVELGMKSRIVAEGVRKITAAHRLLEIGLITGPRFFLTYRHYMEHGGFGLPFGQAPQKPAQGQVSSIHNESRAR